MGPLRLGAATPTKVLTYHTNANDQTSPSILAPHLQCPKFTIHDGWCAGLHNVSGYTRIEHLPLQGNPQGTRKITLLYTMQ